MPESFQHYGQVIETSPDGQEFGPHDVQLDLSRGIPRSCPILNNKVIKDCANFYRHCLAPAQWTLLGFDCTFNQPQGSAYYYASHLQFYIMHLQERPLRFSSTTHHASVTQCLGSIGGHVWYLGVATPSMVESSTKTGDGSKIVSQSPCDHFYVPPNVDEVRVFKITSPKLLKLHVGTWHARPLFKDDAMDFYNLELSNTNVVDHTTHSFLKKNGAVFVIDE